MVRSPRMTPCRLQHRKLLLPGAVYKAPFKSKVACVSYPAGDHLPARTQTHSSGSSRTATTVTHSPPRHALEVPVRASAYSVYVSKSGTFAQTCIRTRCWRSWFSRNPPIGFQTPTSRHGVTINARVGAYNPLKGSCVSITRGCVHV